MLRDFIRRTKTYLLTQGWKWVSTRLGGAAVGIAAGWYVPWDVTSYVVIAVIVIGGLAIAGRAYSEAVSAANEANSNAARANLRLTALERSLTTPSRGRHAAPEEP